MCDETSKYQQYFEDWVIWKSIEKFENLSSEINEETEVKKEENLAKLKQIYKHARLTKYERELFESTTLLGYQETIEIYNIKAISSLQRKLDKIRLKLVKSCVKKGI